MSDRIPIEVNGRVTGYVSREPVEYAEARLEEGADIKVLLGEIKEFGYEDEAVRIIAAARSRVRQ